MRNPNPSPTTSPPARILRGATGRLSLFPAARRGAAFLVAACAILIGSAALEAQIGTGPFAAFPTQNTADGRFLSFGCMGAETMDQPARIALAVPALNTSFDLNVFDGDTATVDAASKRHWDAGNRQLRFSLYADPLREGSTAPENLIGEWFGNAENATSGTSWSSSAATMPDNDWWAVTVTNTGVAQAPSGNYFYNLVIETDGTCESNESLESNLKLAVSLPVTFELSRFSVTGEICQSIDDEALVHPGSSVPAPAVPVVVDYDGSLEMYFSVDAGQTEVRLFEGDFDFGTDGRVAFPSEVGLDECVETDDPDTDSAYADFPFSTAGALSEGAAGPGLPADDNVLDDLRRGEPGDPNGVGCVRYEVRDPENNVYFNDNPSGTAEWEQFLIASAASPFAAAADSVYDGATLPAGTWTIRIVGLDVGNPTLWNAASVCSTRPAREALPEEDPNDVPRAAACPALSTLLLGELVWADTGNLGSFDRGETGISGVLIELVRPEDGTVIATARTGDASDPNWAACAQHQGKAGTSGLACFGVDVSGKYELRIAASNFSAGGPLAGRISTTGGDTTIRSLGGEISMGKDFGYRNAGKK